ncbi:bifunctional UDP-N-acetylglucosamine diphosphorylase/glucosamine-1-phosphate N-acetyltransferase GlmU [Ruania alkalisoli]|uniref:Bifunctional protein GlmU n=1 Tax=Ruania alkalisoli TaxID=2779775 RepID=A0A7M1SVR2_9MICO|nr:bifunctional UDP-N-acetylglucosamine diphosphorylase/glucosamine-1-phosphate N-acetyltransferase GlmU [Ruania alkalisoli]QOR71659.1 bifunctional UDP-N-acetylglucosamine diphosphorylase/glucosamine-1-phosphate N-acetyltransferase GlmU [Ruania alkalisoli]
MSLTPPAAVIVLAAGQGTRMKSATPKVLHRLAGRSLLGHVLHAATSLRPERLAVVVRHERDLVAAHARELEPSVLIADQDEVPGTGRAVECALLALDAAVQSEHLAERDERAPLAAADGGIAGPVVILSGDVPLLDGPTLGSLVQSHQDEGNAITVLTTVLDDATGYGRVVRDENDQIAKIVEHRDATEAERAIKEMNSGVYVMDSGVLRSALAEVDRANDQGEVYLTDVIALARRRGGDVRAVVTADPTLVEGVNDRVQLAALGAELNRRIVTDWMRAGVTVVDPGTTWIDGDVQLSPDVTILPGTQLHGTTTVGTGSVIGPDTTLTDVAIGENSTVTRTHGTGGQIGNDATVGPFTFFRPGLELGERGKLGAFVEVKNSQIGAGTKVPHLSYIGDATIGEETNIGAASITVNYDGVNKHRTVIGSYARTGADNMFVAPVRVGDGAYTGAGTVVRRDVPPGALGVTTGNQRNIEGWTASRRPGTPAAEAAGRALGDQFSAQAQAEASRRQTDSHTPDPS